MLTRANSLKIHLRTTFEKIERGLTRLKVFPCDFSPKDRFESPI